MVKQVSCANPKNYALTKSKSYVVLKETTDMYYLENDNNKTSKYSKKLFKDIKAGEVKETPRQEVVEEESISVDNYMQHITISSDDDGSFDFDINYNRNGDTYNASPSVDISTTSVSCGLRQVSGINGLVDSISVFARRFNRLNNAQQNELISRLIRNAIDNLRNDINRGVLISTTEDINNFTELHSALEALDAVHIDYNNPSSGNDIRVWVVPAND